MPFKLNSFDRYRVLQFCISIYIYIHIVPLYWSLCSKYPDIPLLFKIGRKEKDGEENLEKFSKLDRSKKKKENMGQYRERNIKRLKVLKS